MDWELDDRIYGYSPRWIESNGTPLPIAIRYSAYGTFVTLVLILLPVLFLLAWLPGLLSPGTTIFAAVAASAYATVFVMSKTEKDLSVRGVAETYRNEIRARFRSARGARSERKQCRPVTYSAHVRSGGLL